ncbi:MAG: UvrB/UvrC motif-containing protein [Devosia sp.]|uniref:UvrB/UvrC motif-containing protein n=1 Tax=Devosia sp. TaxID=1871048 RepID=UPI001A51DBD1|nr:UvrB/UvrC motif-containing protein [Devosia sp.]MBL8597230.1 UvrB/UvrC motif-containing protein [Devosia sp.]
MSSQSIERKVNDLTRRMQEAAEAEDFELAARLRNEIEELKEPSVRKPPPGQMGLGTHVPVAAPPKGWKRPKKPDPMTTNVKRGR